MMYRLRVYTNDFYKDYQIDKATVKKAVADVKEKFNTDFGDSKIKRIQLLNFTEHTDEILKVLVGSI